MGNDISGADALTESLHSLLQLSVSHTDFSSILQGNKSSWFLEQERGSFACRNLKQKQLVRVETPLSDQTRTWSDHYTSVTHISTCASSHVGLADGFLQDSRLTDKARWMWNAVNKLLYTLCSVFLSWCSCSPTPAGHCVCIFVCLSFVLGRVVFEFFFNTSKGIVSIGDGGGRVPGTSENHTKISLNSIF